jgi:hypothetical protein
MRHFLSKWSLVVAVNIAILGALAGAVELGYRWFGLGGQTPNPGIFGLKFAPYSMFAISSGRAAVPVAWRDVFHNKDIPAIHDRNNLGFRADDDFDMAASPPPRAPNERIVIITGGSAVHGVGATSSATNVSGVMEAVLNKKQGKYKYRVINMGLGSGISFQEFVILSLYGRWYDPDWIVTMDGWNDAAVACAHTQGAGYPMHYHAMKSYVDGYLSGQAAPSFYRGEWENQLIKFSAAYRAITNKAYVPKEQFTSYEEGWPRIGIPTTWADIPRQVTFYLHAEQLILELSEKAKYIVSIQPIALAYSDVFVPDDVLERIPERLKDRPCGIQTFYDGGLAYFATRAEQGLKRLAKEYGAGKYVSYVNMNDFLPLSHDARKNFLIDNMHLNDAGNRIVGEFYAARILDQDFPSETGRFEREGRTAIEGIIGGPLPDVQTLRKKMDMTPEERSAQYKGTIRTKEASYGMNCLDWPVPPQFRKNVFAGNVSHHVAAACDMKETCDFAVDAGRIGDPANSCPKDFKVEWSCDDHPKSAWLPGEANGQSVHLSCAR